MTKKVFLHFLFLAAFVFQSSAIFRTPEGGRYYYWMMSPDLMSLSMGLAGTEKPSGFVINPASSAFIQNLKVEFSYGAAPGLWSQSGKTMQSASDFFLPLMVNGGFVYPSRFGNFALYMSYMNMSNEGYNGVVTNDLDIGKTGSIYFGFAKDYNDNFSFGFSGNMKFSYNPHASGHEFDIGGGVDLGLIFRPDWRVGKSDKIPYWGLQDFQFAVLLKDSGKPLTNYVQNNNDFSWMPAPFTPGIGVTFNLFNNGSTHWKILSDLSGPFFQNLLFALGTEIQIMNFLVLRGSYTFDLEGVLECAGAIPQYGDKFNIYNFAGGMSLKFSSDSFRKKSKAELTESKHLKTEFSVDLGARPYQNGMAFMLGGVVQFGVKDTNPPVVNYSVKNIYASPNFDGVQDTIEIALDIRDERYIKSWYLEIYNEARKVVRLIESKDDRPETLDFIAVVKRYFSPKTGIPVPSKVIWDCRDNSGNIVEDGNYTFKFFAMDDNKNFNPEGSVEGSIVINTKKPEMKPVIQNRIFSPGSGGTREKLIIDLDIIRGEAINIIETGMMELDVNLPDLSIIESETVNNEAVTEQKWFVDIKNVAGHTVRSFVFNEKGKHRIEWNGMDNNGNAVPDGVYKIVLYSRDLPGNYFEETVSNIIIDTQPKPITLQINKNIFSPNNDGVKDTITFTLDIPVKEGIEKWELDIVDNENKIFRSFTGERLPPQTIVWDGKNEGGQVGKEVSYVGRLNVYYVNGTRSTGTTPSFAVDITPPSGRVNKYTEVFSPNNSGTLDEAVFEQVTGVEDEWNGVIYNEAGNPVKRYIWRGQAPSKFTWDGKSDLGVLLQDGMYYYQLSSTDRAGNSFKSDKYKLEINTADVPLFVSYSFSHFGPTGNGVRDAQVFNVRMQPDAADDVNEWTLTIYNDRENEVFVQKGRGKIPSDIRWDGKNKSGAVSSDGNYYASVNVLFRAGTTSAARTGFFTLDTVLPEIKISSARNVFSPDGDGQLDTFEILQRGSKEDAWEAFVYDSGNNVVWKTFYTDSEPRSREVWDGRDLNGNILSNGMYRYVIKGTDKAGNSAAAVLENIEIKVLHTPVFVTIDKTQFAPNGNGKFDTLDIMPYVTVNDDIEVYTVDIINSSGAVVKKFQGRSRIPEKITWNGDTDSGSKASDGVYYAKLTVLYRFGNVPTVNSQNFILDTTPPDISVSYKPEFFSPDNDGVDDELSIFIKTEDLAGVAEWKLTVKTPSGRRDFMTFSGKGTPASKIVWDGVGTSGELVESAEDYPVVLYAVDNVGNVIEKELDPVNVDILVIRLPDGRLRIKISSIEFIADSPNMIESEKNVRILNMLARALRKYNNYNITIEGHANRFAQGLDENRARTLSEQRSRTIAGKLRTLGISLNRMRTIGKGFDEPLVPLTPDADRDELAKNRRVEFYLDR